MKKKLYVFALALFGMTLTACGGNGSVGLDYDDSDLDIDTEWVDYSVPVTNVKFDSGENSIIVARGETHEYSYSVEPAKASKKSLSWSSANEAVAIVKEGVVEGVEAGKTIVTVSNNENSFDQINLNVEVIVPVTNISFNDTTLLADFNHTYILNIIYTPFDTTQKEVNWHSSDESIATVDDNGNLTTKDVAGSVSITATSAYINKVIELNVEVADRTVYPDAVNIDEYESEVEVGKNFTMKASAVVSSDPNVMPTHPEVKYYSSNPEVLYVEEDSGIVHALGVGNTTIYATAMGKNGPISSETKTVSVFEVKVQSIILSDISLTNRDGRSDIAIPLEYTTDKAGYPVASIPKFVYEVADTSVATVTEAGKLFAVAQVGTTTLTVSETRSGVTKTVNLSVGYEVDSVSISGSSEVNVGSTTKLNVSTIPGGVPSEYVTFTSNDTNIATVSETGVVSGVSAGSTTITATVLGVSETISITVSVPEIPFAYDMTYIVGDKDYSSGESKPSSTGSWDRANQAKAIDEVVQQPHDTLLYERRAIVKFNDGDIWKLRNATSYLEIDGYITGTYRIGEYKINEGAFVGTSPDMSVTADNNIIVNRTGYYAIYHAQYTNEHPEGWYSIYVGRYELNISDTTPEVQVGTSVTLLASDWAGTLSYEVTEGASLIEVTRGSGANIHKFEITAKDTVGTAKIVFTDDWRSVEVIVTITSDAPLPKTFEDGVPYVVGNADFHTGVATGSGNYWGSDASKAMKFEVSTAPKDDDVIVQYEATIKFVKDNQFKVVIGGTTLFWNLNYEDTDGAFKKGQMSRPDNVVVNVDGTYKIYVKCLDNNRGWSVYVEPNSEGPTPGTDVPAEDGYYLVGSESDWKYDGATKMSAGKGTDLAELIGYEATAGEEFRIRGYINDTDTWYIWGQAEEGHEEDNYVVGLTDRVVDIYLNSEGKYYVFDHTDPVVYSYYLAGTFTSTPWAIEDDNLLTQDTTDTNKYVINDVELSSGDVIKINNPALGDEGWYGVDHTYDNCHFTVGDNGNCVVGDSGTYDVEFYLSSSDGNHIVLKKDSGGDTPVDPPTPTTEKTYYFTCPNSWSSLHVYYYGDGGAVAPWPGVEMTYVGQNEYGQSIYSVVIDTVTYTTVIFNSGSYQTRNILLSEFGTNNACYVSEREQSNNAEVTFWTKA